nr:DNA recombination protein RmuC [Pseudomonas sp.]
GVKKALDTASNRIGLTETRTRVMLRNLRTVEELPEAQASALLDVADDADSPSPLTE